MASKQTPKKPSSRKEVHIVAQFSGGKQEDPAKLRRKLIRAVDAKRAEFESLLKDQVMKEFAGSDVSLVSVRSKKPVPPITPAKKAPAKRPK